MGTGVRKPNCGIVKKSGKRKGGCRDITNVDYINAINSN